MAGGGLARVRCAGSDGTSVTCAPPRMRAHSGTPSSVTCHTSPYVACDPQGGGAARRSRERGGASAHIVMSDEAMQRGHESLYTLCAPQPLPFGAPAAERPCTPRSLYHLPSFATMGDPVPHAAPPEPVWLVQIAVLLPWYRPQRSITSCSCAVRVFSWPHVLWLVLGCDCCGVSRVLPLRFMSHPAGRVPCVLGELTWLRACLGSRGL